MSGFLTAAVVILLLLGTVHLGEAVSLRPSVPHRLTSAVVGAGCMAAAVWLVLTHI